MSLTIILIGIILHQLVYLSSKGMSKYRTNIYTIGNLNIGFYGLMVLDILLFSSTVFCLFFNHPISYAILTIVLSIHILSFSKRLSNHLILAWFIILFNLLVHLFAKEYSVKPLHSFIQILFLLTLFFAGFHKLNTHFFNYRTSCGSGSLLQLALLKGINIKYANSFFVYIGIYFVVILECASIIPIAFNFFPFLYLIPLILMIIGFGFIAHIHFSTIMLGCLFAFIPNITLTYSTFSIIIIVAISILLYKLFGNYYNYKNQKLSKVNFLMFSILSTFLCYQLILNIDHFEKDFSGIMRLPKISIFLVGIYILNGISPYLGLKYEFSYAMFSNLKHTCENHFLIKRTLFKHKVRYVEILNTKNIPEKYLIEFFKDQESCYFNIGYVVNVAKHIWMHADDKHIQIVCRQINAVNRFEISKSKNPKIRFSEKLAVFPFQISKDDTYTIPA